MYIIMQPAFYNIKCMILLKDKIIEVKTQAYSI